jgi:hypothetical protein
MDRHRAVERDVHHLASTEAVKVSLRPALIIGVTAVVSDAYITRVTCSSATDMEPFCDFWKILFVALCGVAALLVGLQHVKKYRAKLAPARSIKNPDSIALMFDTPNVRAHVRVLISRGGDFQISAASLDVDGPRGKMLVLCISNNSSASFSPGMEDLDEANITKVFGANLIGTGDDGGAPLGIGAYGTTSITDLEIDGYTSKAATVHVLRQGHSTGAAGTFAQGSVAPLVAKDGTTSSQEAGSAPLIIAVDSVTQSGSVYRGDISAPATGFEVDGRRYYPGRDIQIELAVLGGEGSGDLPMRYELLRSNPSTTSNSGLSWTCPKVMQPSWLLIDQELRDSASNDALIAGVLLGIAGGFISLAIEKVVGL